MYRYNKATMTTELNNEINNYSTLPPVPPTDQILSIIHPNEIDVNNSHSMESSLTPAVTRTLTPAHIEKETPIIENPIIENECDVVLEFKEGEFLYVKDGSKEMLINAWNAITQLNLWDYMKLDTYSYMFSCDNEITLISKKMEELGYNGHSGCSFGWTMRQMQYIAQNGEIKYMNRFSAKE